MSSTIGMPISPTRTVTHVGAMCLWVVLTNGTNFARYSYRKVA